MFINNKNKNTSILLEALAALFTVSANFPDNRIWGIKQP